MESVKGCLYFPYFPKSGVYILLKYISDVKLNYVALSGVVSVMLILKDWCVIGSDREHFHVTINICSEVLSSSGFSVTQL